MPQPRRSPWCPGRVAEGVPLTPVGSPPDLLAWAQMTRLAALEQLTQLGANLSACAMARSGRSFPAYKFHEGRMAALGALARALRSQEAAPQVAVETLVTEWTGAVERHGSSGRDWQAYAAGGLDAALDARAQLTR